MWRIFQGEDVGGPRELGLAWIQVLEAGGVLAAEQIDIQLEVQAVEGAATEAAGGHREPRRFSAADEVDMTITIRRADERGHERSTRGIADVSPRSCSR